MTLEYKPLVVFEYIIILYNHHFAVRMQEQTVYRLYPWPAGYKTHYIPQERSVLEWSRGSASGEFRGGTKALAFPKGCNGSYIRWPGIQLTYTMLSEYTV